MPVTLRPGTVAVLQARSFNGFFKADLASVAAVATEGARLAKAAGNLYVLMVMMMNLGPAALASGDLDGSWPLLAGALRLGLQIDDRVVPFYLLDVFGCHAALSGRAGSPRSCSVPRTQRAGRPGPA